MIKKMNITELYYLIMSSKQSFAERKAAEQAQAAQMAKSAAEWNKKQLEHWSLENQLKSANAYMAKLRERGNNIMVDVARVNKERSQSRFKVTNISP